MAIFRINSQNSIITCMYIVYGPIYTYDYENDYFVQNYYLYSYLVSEKSFYKPFI